MNSVRHARWYSKLGLQRSSAFLVNLASLRPDGGLAPAIRVVVSKQYPMLYMHPQITESNANTNTNTNTNESGKSSDASDAPPVRVRKLHCNQRSHDRRMQVHESLCEQRIDQLQAAYLDHTERASKTTRTLEQIAADEEEWAQKRQELEADLQEVQKQVTPYLKVHCCEITEQRNISERGAHYSPADVDPSSPSPLVWSGECCSFIMWRPTDDTHETMTPGRGHTDTTRHDRP